MKKVLLFLLTLLGLAGLYWFWPGPEPSLPAADELVAISLVSDEGTVGLDQPEQIAALLAELRTARKTRQESVNDSPAIQPYTRLVFHHRTGGEGTAYLYETYTGTYLEQPYVGIYRLNHSLQSWLDQPAE